MDATTLRVSRAVHRIGVSELAAKAGISRYQVWRYESGATPIPPERAVALANALSQPREGRTEARGVGE